MRLTEIRDLDGPNLFAPEPVVKLEIACDTVPKASKAADASGDLIRRLHLVAELPVPEIIVRHLDTPGHVAVCFPWEWRSASIEIAEQAWSLLAGASAAPNPDAVAAALEQDRASGDRPLWVRDADRSIPILGITGTNGKTTTTRLISHILREAGKRVGWSSSSGVYIDGEQVIEGDYTGPSGARRVLEDPTVDIGVLETARGGILLRGLAYESNDLGVFLNVSADHLDMQGVTTVETLAEVKGIVVRVTKPSGVVVLNADDPLVLAQRAKVKASVLLFSARPGCEAVCQHVAGGGRAVVCDSDAIWLDDAGARIEIAKLANVPMTFGGAATHMVENALAATSAAIGLGLPVESVAAGLATFRSDLRSNAGRLNVFRLGERLVVVDYAHNESGLEALLAFTRRLMQPTGRLSVIIGTAGDRQDSVLARLGEIAVRDADRIFIKENPKYLRGRPLGQQTELIRAAIDAHGGSERVAGAYPSELDAFVACADMADAGDAIAVMCVEEQLAIYRELRDRGAEEWQ